MAEAGPQGLDAALLEPASKGQFPLVLMLSSRLRQHDEPATGPQAMQPEAIWFARRGYAVLMIMPLGEGLSGGKWQNIGACDEGSVTAYNRQFSEVLAASYTAVSKLPEIDTSKVVAVGDFIGSTAAMWLQTDPPPGLKGVLAIGSSPWFNIALPKSCMRLGVAPALMTLGTQSKAPVLWIFRGGDGKFPVKFAQIAMDAFTAGGGKAEIHMFPKPKDDALTYFDIDDSLWTPTAEKFLSNLALPSVAIEPQPVPPVLQLAPGTSDKIKAAFAKYVAAGPGKAFAIGTGGRYGWSSCKATVKSAQQDAIDRCAASSCKIVASEE